MTTLSARAIIRAAFGGAKNVITPDVIEIGKLGRNAAYELSGGDGLSLSRLGSLRMVIDRSVPRIYGVTIVRVNPTTGEVNRADDLCDSFGGYDTNKNFQDAKAYVAQLKAKVKAGEL